MATIKDLEVRSVSDLSPTEGLDLIVRIRASRMTPTIASHKRSKKASKQSPTKLFDRLTKGQIDWLLDEAKKRRS